MGFITTKKGIKRVHLVVPDNLVSVIGKINFLESLDTKDNHVASRRRPGCHRQVSGTDSGSSCEVCLPMLGQRMRFTMVMRWKPEGLVPDPFVGGALGTV
jgi:hypothetical protein